MRGRNYSLRTMLERMQRFWACCRQLLPWDYFRVARHSGTMHEMTPIARRLGTLTHLRVRVSRA